MTKEFKFNDRMRLFNGWIKKVESEMIISVFYLYLRVFKLRNSDFNTLEPDSKKLVHAYQNLKVNDLIYFLCRLMIYFCSNSCFTKSSCRAAYARWVNTEFSLVCKQQYLESLVNLFDCDSFELLEHAGCENEFEDLISQHFSYLK